MTKVPVDPYYAQPAPRPGVLNLVTVASFVLSAANVLWLIVVALLVLLAGAASWIGGPVVGAIGTTIGAVVLGLVVVQFLLSLILFRAALKTWGGDPGGRSLHKTWAWLTVALDLIDLLFTGGMDVGAWVRLGYAAALIYVLDKPEVRAYFSRLPYAPAAGLPHR